MAALPAPDAVPRRPGRGAVRRFAPQLNSMADSLRRARLGGRVLEAPGLEELEQLLARGLVVPGAVAAEGLQQRVGGRRARSSAAFSADGQVDAGLVVVRVGGQPGLVLRQLAARLAPRGGQLQRGADGGDLGVVAQLGAARCRAPRRPGPPRPAPAGRGRRRRRRRRSPAPAGAGRRRARSAPWWSPSSAAAFASASRSAEGIWPPASFSSVSMKRFTSLSGSAPWNMSAIWPCQKAATVGTDCSGRPSWASCWTRARFLSMSIFTSRTRPPAARTTFSSVGVSCLQGPHQVAQKSTSTGTSREAATTSCMKVFWSPSLIMSAAGVLRGWSRRVLRGLGSVMWWRPGGLLAPIDAPRAALRQAVRGGRGRGHRSRLTAPAGGRGLRGSAEVARREAVVAVLVRGWRFTGPGPSSRRRSMTRRTLPGGALTRASGVTEPGRTPRRSHSSASFAMDEAPDAEAAGEGVDRERRVLLRDDEEEGVRGLGAEEEVLHVQARQVAALLLALAPPCTGAGGGASWRRCPRRRGGRGGLRGFPAWRVHLPAREGLQAPPTRVRSRFRTERGRSSGVEHDLAKVGVEGSNPFARSNFP